VFPVLYVYGFGMGIGGTREDANSEGHELRKKRWGGRRLCDIYMCVKGIENIFFVNMLCIQVTSRDSGL
jgi:hypothetical protein